MKKASVFYLYALTPLLTSDREEKSNMYGDLEVGARGLVRSKDLDFGFGFLPGISVLFGCPKFEFPNKI
jgi:hypothetical protein